MGHGFGAQPRYWDGSNPKSSRTSGYQFQGHFILIHTDISDVWTWAAKIYQSLRDRHVDLTAPYDSRTPFCLHEWTRLKICDAGIGHRQKIIVSKIILTSNQEICSGCSSAWVALILQLEQTCVWKHSIRWTSAGLAKAGHFVPFPVAGQGSGILKLLLFKKSRRSAVVANYKKGWSFIPPYTTFMKIGDGLPLLYQHFPKLWQVLVTNRTHFHFPPSEAPRRRHVAPRHHWATKNFAGEKMRSWHGLVQNWYITISCYMCVYYIWTHFF